MVAPASRLSPEVVDKVLAVAKRRYPERTPEIVFHPQCFATHGHFAGDDDTRAQAFLDVANDESYRRAVVRARRLRLLPRRRDGRGPVERGGAAQDLSGL